jgi:hypothetical protein
MFAAHAAGSRPVETALQISWLGTAEHGSEIGEPERPVPPSGHAQEDRQAVGGICYEPGVKLCRSADTTPKLYWRASEPGPCSQKALFDRP